MEHAKTGSGVSKRRCSDEECGQLNIDLNQRTTGLVSATINQDEGGTLRVLRSFDRAENADACGRQHSSHQRHISFLIVVRICGTLPLAKRGYLS